MQTTLNTRIFRSILKGLVLVLILTTLPNPISIVLASPELNPPTAPQAASSASVILSTDGDVMLGEEFTLTAIFSNNSSTPGYGPFIDLYIPQTGADGLIDEDPDLVGVDLGIYGDGINDGAPNALDGVFPASGSNFTATYQGSGLTVTTLTIPDEGTDGRGCVEHPLAVINSDGDHGQVCGYAGDQVVVIELPFGSFTQDQPSATVRVPMRLSEFADISSALNIRARAGFQFGDTAMIDWCCPPYDNTALSDTNADGDTWSVSTPVNPTLYTFTKESAGETPTGPNYVRTFIMALDVADGQALDNLTITDTLDANLSYIPGTVSCAPAADTCSITGSDLLVEYNSTFTGSTGNDITITFDYYLDTILPDNTGAPLGINNTANFTADWDTTDSRDPDSSIGGPGIGTVTGVTMTAGKSSVNITDSQFSPGDIIQHTISMDVSDYFAFEDLEIPADVLSDGQHFYTATQPEISLTMNGTTNTATFDAAYYSVTCNYTGAVADGSTECDNLDGAADDGTTTLYFDISGQLIASGLHPAGQVLGGLVSDGTADNSPTSLSVTYYTEVLDAYTDISGEASLNSNDSVSNNFTIYGELLDAATCNEPLPANAGTCTTTYDLPFTDGGSTTLTVPKLALTKDVFAVNGTSCSTAGACDEISPGDLVTYELTYDLLTGDFENLSLTDYLPLPVFNVLDSSYPWIEYAGANSYPDAGTWMRGPADTQSAQPGGPDPVVSIDGVNNSVHFNFGTFADPTNTGYKIDLLFSVTTTDEPFADALKLTNQVEQYDENTGSTSSTGTEIAQITLRQPVLLGEKSAVATDNPNIADYSAGGVTFSNPGTTGTPPWTGVDINSDYLDNYPLSTDISGVDAGDMVTFVIVVENTGGSGGFDITLRDTLPGGYVFPAGGINLQVYNGAGDPIGFDGAEADLFSSTGVVVTDPPAGAGACQAHALSSGENVLIVTYDLQVDPEAVAGQLIENIGELVDYAGSEGGEGHLEEPQEESSTTTIGSPTLEKNLIGTELNNPQNTGTQVVIGELVAYQLKVELPEGKIENFRLEDQLDSGLAFHSINRFEVKYVNSSGTEVGTASFGQAVTDAIQYDGTLTYPTATPTYPMELTNSGRTMTFDFGELKNTDTDNTLTEVLFIEYFAIVQDVVANQAGVSLNNEVVMKYDTYDGWDDVNGVYIVRAVETSPISADVVTIIEPTLTVAKSVINTEVGKTTYDAGDTVRYTFVLRNDSTTDAYNVEFYDQFPFDSIANTSKLDLSSSTITIDSDSNTTTPVTAADFEIVPTTGNGPFTIQLKSTTDLTMEPGRVIVFYVDAVIYATARAQDLFDNTAFVEWTSLPDTETSPANPNAGDDEVNRSTDASLLDDKERTGEGGVDDYIASSNTSFNINTPTISKQLLGTEIDNSATTNTNNNTQAVIGELVKYQLRVELSEGNIEDFRLVDNLAASSQSGLAFHSLTRFEFLYEDGSGTSMGDASGDITYTGTDNTFGSITAPLTVTSSGQLMTFDFGTLHNNNNNSSLTEVLYIEYYAVVLNAAAIQSGDNLQNEASMIYDTYVWNNTTHTDDLVNDVTVGPVKGTAVSIIEPVLDVSKTVINITKGSVNDNYDAGDEVEFTVTLQHAGSSETDAYDVDFKDTLPVDDKLTGLNITNVTDTNATTPLQLSSFTLDISSNPDEITINALIPKFEIGRVVTITMRGNIYATPFPGEQIPNKADTTWTSLPDTDTGPTNPNAGTDEVNRSTYNEASDERTGDNSVYAYNDYADTVTTNIEVEDPGAAKFIFDSDQLHTQDQYLVIGETVTYAVRITLPESTTPDLKVIDTLPAGLQFVDGSQALVTTVAASKGLLSADFLYSGAFQLDTITPYTISGTGATGSPQTITFDFDAITVPNDLLSGNNSFLLTFDAIVLNDAGNQHGDTLTNNVRTDIDGDVVTGAPVDVIIIEPALTINKTATPNNPTLNEEITYQIVVENPNAPNPSDPPNAYEVVVTDVVPAGLTLDASSISPTPDTVVGNTITWVLGDMPTNTTSATLEYKVTVDGAPTNSIGDTLTNNAIVTWSSLNGTPTIERDGSGGINDYTTNDTAAVTVTNLDLTLSKDDGVNAPNTAAPGDTLSYVLTYANIGNAPADNATITETVPDNTSFNNAASTSGWSCAAGGGAGDTCTFSISGGVPKAGDTGSTGTVTFAVDVDNPIASGVTEIANEATISTTDTGHGIDPTPSNNTSNDTDNLTAAPDIAITKTDGVASAIASQTLTYTLTVANNGDQDATGVDVTDVLPEHVQYVSASNNPDGLAASYDAATHTVTWPSFDLAGGGTSVNLTIEVTVFDPFPIDYNSITNNASAYDDGSNGPDTTSDNTASDTDTVDTSTALLKAIVTTDQTETSGLTIAAIGEVVTYQIRVTLSEESYTSIQVYDNLPVGMDYVPGSLVVDSSSLNGTLPAETVTASGGSGSSVIIDFGATTITADGDDDNNSFVIRFNALVLNEATNQNGTTLTNTVSTFTNGSTTASNTDSVDIDVVEPELGVSKSNSNATPNLDDTISYTITVNHLGSSTENAYDLVIVDTLPAGVTYQTGTATPAATYDSVGHTLTWTVASFDMTASALTFTYDVKVDSASATPGNILTNSVDLTWTSLSGAETGERNGTDGTGGLNDHQASANSGITYSTPDLSLTKDDGVMTAEPNDTLSYTLTFTNSGNIAATGTVITETVPAYTTFNETASGGPGIWSCANGSPAGTVCTHTIGTLAAGATSSVTFAVDVDSIIPATVTILENTASIADDGNNGTDPTPLNNTNDDDDTLNAAPDIAITKTDGQTNVSADQTLTYTLTVTNNGNQNATGVDVTDVLPEHVQYVSASNTPDGLAASYNAATHTVTWPSFDLAGGGTSVNLTYVVTVFDPFPIGYNSITNNASAYDDGSNGSDPTPSNNTTSDTDTVDTSTALVKTIIATNQTETTGLGIAAIGEIVTYEINVTLAEESYSSLTVYDDLPAGMDYVPGSLVVNSSSLNGTLPAETVTASGGSGSDVRVDFGATTVTADGDDTNNSFVIRFDALVVNETGNQNGDTLTNTVETYINGSGVTTNTDSVDIDVVEPELGVSKSNSNATPNLDDTISYTITVNHLGSSTENAYDLVIVDTLPAGVTYQTGTATPAATYDSVGHTLTWTVASFDMTASALTFTYDVTVNNASATPGNILTNSVDLTWTSLSGAETGERNGTDGTGGLNDHQASANSGVTYSTPDLSLTKDDGVMTAEPNDTLSYTLTFTNSGNIAATGTVITETVPVYTTFNETASGGPGIWSCANGSPAGTLCTHNIGTLAAGATSSVTFAVDVDSSVPATVTILENTASIADDGNNGTDPTPGNNSDTDTDSINAEPDIAVSKTDGLTVVAANSTLTYTITVENLGNQDATGVDVIDTLPTGVTFVSASDNPDGLAATYNSGTHTVTWDAFDMVVGASETLTVVVTVDNPMTATSLTNTVEANDDGSNGPDTDITNNTFTDTDNKSSVSKTLVGTSEATTITNSTTGHENVTIGEILTYDVVFPVPGNSNMDNLVITDLLGEGLAFMDCVSITPDLLTIFTTISGTPSNDFSNICANPTVNDIPAADPTNPIGDGRQVVFNFGDIYNSDPSEGTLTVRYRAVVLDVPENSFDVQLDNEVDINWIGGNVTANGSPSLTIVEPDLDLTKTIDTNTAVYGQIVTYTLHVFTTDRATSDAFDVVLIDEVPTGVEYVPGSLTYTAGVAPTSIDDSDPLNLAVSWDHIPLGQTSTLTFEATVIAATHNTEVVNSANVAWSSLPGDISTPQSIHNAESTERYYDPADPADFYIANASASFRTPALPETGFAPGVFTEIPAQPEEKAYDAVDGMTLEIPSLGVYMPVAGIPLENGQWDVTWLWDEAGFLDGTAFPTTPGNSVLTSHVYLPNGNPGPFVNLHTLMWGDQVIIHYNGDRYVFEVRDLTRVIPENLSVIDHQEYPWLTLMTCQGFQKATGEYAYRIAVKAVLIAVEAE